MFRIDLTEKQIALEKIRDLLRGHERSDQAPSKAFLLELHKCLSSLNKNYPETKASPLSIKAKNLLKDFNLKSIGALEKKIRRKENRRKRKNRRQKYYPPPSQSEKKVKTCSTHDYFIRAVLGQEKEGSSETASITIVYGLSPQVVSKALLLLLSSARLHSTIRPVVDFLPWPVCSSRSGARRSIDHRSK